MRIRHKSLSDQAGSAFCETEFRCRFSFVLFVSFVVNGFSNSGPSRPPRRARRTRRHGPGEFAVSRFEFNPYVRFAKRNPGTITMNCEDRRRNGLRSSDSVFVRDAIVIRQSCLRIEIFDNSVRVGIDRSLCRNGGVPKTGSPEPQLGGFAEIRIPGPESSVRRRLPELGLGAPRDSKRKSGLTFGQPAFARDFDRNRDGSEQ
jgi:hypothetical protein